MFGRGHLWRRNIAPGAADTRALIERRFRFNVDERCMAGLALVSRRAGVLRHDGIGYILAVAQELTPR